MFSPSSSPLVWILAGEASGDVLGARLMHALRARVPNMRFAGVGGVRMQEEGLVSLFPMRDLAVMGLVEVLPRVRQLSARLDEAAQDIAAQKPDLVITIDSPGFALRLLKKISGLGIARVHYVAPQVWAWRQKRVKEFPGLWEELLCLLPFEEKFFGKHGLKTRFVGHPVLQSGAKDGDAARFRARHGLPDSAKILVLMPGSRRSEAPRLLPVFGQMLRLLKTSMPDVVPVVPVSPVVASVVERATQDWPIKPVIVTDIHDKHDAFAAAGAALTKSGTSTLELALAGVPMAVTYRVNPITAFFARRLIKVPFVAMVNLLAGRAVVPELLQEQCRADVLAREVQILFENTDVAQAQKQAFATVLHGLEGPQGQLPADAAAEAVLEVLNRKNTAKTLG
ncbi:lipid-A-disaccharide synthase [Acetobacter pasteurianus]|uniref:Lipid-A-disaccharide synthase n=2 Tax=Acetobacter TaxID=434 RepID=C7JBX3_ACEP3|nr:lipid-A-disaccharide synthase [Acetobacter pasteurianus]BAH99867.1 lipid-A-disaccharide synthase [Acetobacter pasteurianus IFO 3283-01]BAI02920.1 lipid-A-disaccharide synthase [Acetobacter pasteurianus IFO 3283-03]BAI05966.1 lipid-A-disaccharide synthase [Acetobacter pasteurianus IFO 3283-07]BAI09015.1 lipid-A-disaccharide synthase [Acetobacter pasteurianus IFO 3283-22]BAI12063.1 lipid-A-disaccharide synthase [Acetobacter pasteurianus IFO 3283-26]